MKLSESELNTAKEALKYRMRCGATNVFEEYETEIENIKSLLLRSSEVAESNSLIIVGPRGCGKTSVRTFLYSSNSKMFQQPFPSLYRSFKKFYWT